MGGRQQDLGDKEKEERGDGEKKEQKSYDRRSKEGFSSRKIGSRWDRSASRSDENVSNRDRTSEKKRKRSRSPRSDKKDGHRRRRSHSYSASPSRSRHSRRDTGRRGRDSFDEKRGVAQHSKWARHRDKKSAEISSSEEDRELERTYQMREGGTGEKAGVEEDLFGLDKILS